MWWWHWWLPLQHWLAIHTGTVNEAGPYYGFFSGAGSDLGELTLLGGLIAIYRRHNCHTAWCWRFGHHDFTDEATRITYRLCRRHHPLHWGRRLRGVHIGVIHERNQQGDGDETQHP